MTQARPNILILVNDHQLYYRHGWDNGLAIQRPYFEQLAADGIEFGRAYSACPLCTPVRQSILTALLPHTHGQLQNAPERPIQFPTYYDHLAQANYSNYYFGKWHTGSTPFTEQHCIGFTDQGYGNPYLTDTYQAYLKMNGLPHPTIQVERDFGQKAQPPPDVPYQQNEIGCFEHMSGIMTAPDDCHEAFFLANLACNKLDELAADQTDAPFTMRVDFWSPHQPYFPTEQFAALYDPQEIPVYDSFHDDLTNKPTTYQRELNHPLSTSEGKLIQPNPLPWAEWQKVLARCYAQVTLVDAAGGRILEKLESLGLAENTVVIWTSDHGDALASHGGHFNKRCYLPEEVLRIPLAIRYPGQVKPKQRSDALVSNLDLGPTILDFAGLQFDSSVHGQSLRALCLDRSVEWRDSLMCETNGHYDSVTARALICNQYKYIWTHNDLDELYDLTADPFELHNLIRHPNYQSARTIARSQLAHWLQKTNDPAYHLFCNNTNS